MVGDGSCVTHKLFIYLLDGTKDCVVVYVIIFVSDFVRNIHFMLFSNYKSGKTLFH